MKKDSKIPFLLIILLLLLLYSSFSQAPLMKPMPPPLYQGQQTILASDSAHHWAREHRANSVFTIEMKNYADIQIFNNPKKTGKPLFHVRMLTDSSFGSGSVVSNLGHILSAKHVVDNTEEIKKIAGLEAFFQRDNPDSFIKVKAITEYTLVAPDGKEFAASVVATDKNDLSLLQVRNKNGFTAPAIEISLEKVLSDKSVIIIGSPIGVKDVIMDGRIARQAFTKKNEEGSVYSYIVAPIVPGNSGGPVITLSDMKIVGVIVVVMKDENSYTSISYMVPNNVILKFLEKNLPKK